VDAYVKYRPSYPAELLETLRAHCGLTEHSVVADIGSGTGISTRLFLSHGNRVYGVEPNVDMRSAAEGLLSEYPEFVSKNGRAEATGLDPAAIDFVVAAQAFHWFDRDACRREFIRILRPGGWVVLLWNVRLSDTTAFLRAYELLLRQHAEDYASVNHKDVVSESSIAEFFRPGSFGAESFASHQTLDFEGLFGRAMSASYVPELGTPRHAAFAAELRAIFDAHAEDGRVRIEYATRLFWGRLE
jgi:SAM-dependent methyltransferase